MSKTHNDGYYPLWLTDKECGDTYKAGLVKVYDEYYTATDKEIKKKKLDELRISLTVVSDIVAYRYLIKYYTNLFRKLNITIEEYLDYKVDRMYMTIRDKKERIDDIMSYVYMSFMLSSPRLIYDYAEKIGRCKLVKENLPYFMVQRLKFFFIERENTIEHLVLTVDNIDLDEDSEVLRSNLEKYSLIQYNKEQTILNTDSGFDTLRNYIAKLDFKYETSKQYLLSIFDNWRASGEEDYELTKQTSGIKNPADFSLFDYIRYKYENKIIDLSYEEYLDVLDVLNKLLKGRKNFRL